MRMHPWILVNLQLSRRCWIRIRIFN